MLAGEFKVRSGVRGAWHGEHTLSLMMAEQRASVSARNTKDQ